MEKLPETHLTDRPQPATPRLKLELAWLIAKKHGYAWGQRLAFPDATLKREFDREWARLQEELEGY